MTLLPDWTAEEIDTLRKMRANGSTLDAIGRALGRTRNAVSGKVNRLGLSLPDERRWVMPRACKPKRTPKPKPTPKPVVARSAPPEPAPQPVVSLAYARPFMSRASRECAWLLDDGRSCCAPTVMGGSYCAGHRALVYRPTAKLDANKMARRFG
jgi:hypothetical protein